MSYRPKTVRKILSGFIKGTELLMAWDKKFGDSMSDETKATISFLNKHISVNKLREGTKSRHGNLLYHFGSDEILQEAIIMHKLKA